jgi:hypothetical protein
MKHASEMTPEEFDAALTAMRRPKPATQKVRPAALDMTDDEFNAAMRNRGWRNTKGN